MTARLLDLQRRMRELGRIRSGHQVPTKNGKTRPAALELWRLTSQSREHLEAAAVVYGGTVAPWNPGNGLPAQFELFTEVARLRIIVPPGVTFSQAWELWSGGGCQRRCDGQRELLSDQPCMCPADYDARREAAQTGRACKPTTRVNVMLPEIPDIGVWRLESHGFYAAVELAGAYDLIEMATQQGRMIPAYLRLEQRVVKRPGKPRQEFVVPVIEIAHTTGQVLQALGVLDESSALGSAPALGVGEQRALPAPSAPTALSNGGGVVVAEVVPVRQSVPPLPPLPHEVVAASPSHDGGDGDVPLVEGEASPPQPSDGQTFKNVGHAAQDAGLDDDGRHDLAEWASEGRTRSTKELSVEEQSRAIAACADLKAGRCKLQRGDDDGAMHLVSRTFGFTHEPESAPPVDLDAARVELRQRIEALGDYGKTAWKNAKLPRLDRLTAARVAEAYDVVTLAENQKPF